MDPIEKRDPSVCCAAKTIPASGKVCKRGVKCIERFGNSIKDCDALECSFRLFLFLLVANAASFAGPERKSAVKIITITVDLLKRSL